MNRSNNKIRIQIRPIIICDFVCDVLLCLKFNHTNLPIMSFKKNNINKTFTYLKTRMFIAFIFISITSIIMIPGMATYLPFHQNDAIGIPTLLFPFIWVGLFIYCFLDNSIKRILLVVTLLMFINIICIYVALAN